MGKEALKASLIAEENRIHDEIRKIYPNSVGLDGILNIDDFIDIKNSDTNPIRILWVLKERGYPDNKINKEFMIKDFMRYLSQYSRWRQTYGNMCSVTEGILEWHRTNDNKFLCYENLPELKVEKSSYSVYYMRENGEQIFPLDYIAFLNVKKLGSRKATSNQNELNTEYAKSEIQKILKEQFDYINADITIIANQVQKLAEDFAKVPFSDFVQCGTCRYYFDSERKKLFIFANHPNVHGNMTNSEYCNSIFDAVKKNSIDLQNGRK